jgi:molybdenum cofactor biosynthesis enzyme MoaA
MIPDKNTFCVMPWYGLTLDSRNRLSPCCNINKWKYTYDQVEDYWKSQELHDLRSDLLNGVKNEICNKCWIKEEHGGQSQRQISNFAVKGKIRSQISNPEIKNIQYFDLTIGNLCNLRCLMCKPSLSSQILAEAIKHPNLKSMHRPTEHYEQIKFDWGKSEDFMRWCEEYLKQATIINLSGGEPLIIPWISDILDKIPATQKRECVLQMTTNLTTINDKIFNSFNDFKKVWLNVSLDGTHETFEYVRNNHDWNLIEKNIQYVESKNSDNVQFGVNHVVQAISYHSIESLVTFCDNHNMLINPITIDRPTSFHISALSTESKQKFLDNTFHYKGYNEEFVKFVRKHTEAHLEQDQLMAKDCVNYLETFDQARGTDWRKVLPVDNLV